MLGFINLFLLINKDAGEEYDEEDDIEGILQEEFQDELQVSSLYCI